MNNPSNDLAISNQNKKARQVSNNSYLYDSIFWSQLPDSFISSQQHTTSKLDTTNQITVTTQQQAHVSALTNQARSWERNKCAKINSC
jgi:hypothetical protein